MEISSLGLLPDLLDYSLKSNLICMLGGVVVEHDENDRLVAKPYNVNEVNKQKALEEEQQPKQSLVTASMLA